MEPRSRRRLRRSPPPQIGAGDPDGDDRISALPDDMLHQVLVRLHCARAAARTGLLSRRWRGLWARLPGLTFRDIPAGKVKSALAHVPRRTAVSLLEIHLMSSVDGTLDGAQAKSLLRAATRLSPEEIVFVLPQCPMIKRGRGVTMVLPCFHRATSVDLDMRFLRIKSPPAGELPMLEMLSISGNIVDVGGLLNSCPRLRMLRIAFRGVQPASLEAQLTTLETAAALGLRVSRLGIEFEDSNRRVSVDSTRFASLLLGAARISPQELLFTNRFPRVVDADLVCFHRTTSIEMNLYNIRFTQLPASEFSALERLALNGCTITDLVTMIIRSPRLRMLKVNAYKPGDVKVHSVSLEELDLDFPIYKECESIHVVTPLLKQLKLKVHGKTNIPVSISAPMVEKVLFCRTYTSVPLIFGFWWLQSVRLETTETYEHKDGVLINDEEGVCSQLPRVHVLSMEISSYNHVGAVIDFASEMEKILVTNFSVLELHLNAKRHVFGAFVLSLLRMHRIRTNTQKLKVFLSGFFQMSPPASECLRNCPCDDPKDWSSQIISLTRLEEVEINNLRGGDHGIDFVTSILRWAPMLTRMTIKLAYEVQQRMTITTIYNICLAYPSVNCSIYLSSGEKLSAPQA